MPISRNSDSIYPASQSRLDCIKWLQLSLNFILFTHPWPGVRLLIRICLTIFLHLHKPIIVISMFCHLYSLSDIILTWTIYAHLVVWFVPLQRTDSRLFLKINVASTLLCKHSHRTPCVKFAFSGFVFFSFAKQGSSNHSHLFRLRTIWAISFSILHSTVEFLIKYV